MYTGTATHTTLLARLAQSDNGGAWAEFQDRYGELIRGFCARRGLQPADIEDVSQDVLLSLTKAMPGFAYDPSKGLFRSYLKTVVVHAISRRLSQKGAGIALSQASEPAADADEDQWEGEWQRYHFRMAHRQVASELSETDLRAFEWYAIEARPVGDVARELDLSVDSVYQIKSRVLKRLSAIIAQQVQDEG